MSRSPGLPGRRLAATAAALLTAGTMSLTLTPTTASAATPRITGFSVTASQANVRTTTGKTVRITTSAYRSSTSNLTITASTANETHSWSFPIANTHFTLSRTGTGKIAPAAAKVLPFAKVALTVKPAGTARTQKCQGQAVGKTQKVSVAGTFWLDTRSGKRWGKAGSKTARFVFRTSALANWSYANTATCGGSTSYVPPCATSVNWGAYNRMINLGGEGRKVFASRYVKLAKPVGATRYDSRNVLARSATFTQDTAANTAKLVVVGNGSTLTGRATLIGQNRSTPDPTACRTAGRQIQTSSWYPTSYTNGAKALRTTDIYGGYTVPNTTSSAYLMRTVLLG